MNNFVPATSRGGTGADASAWHEFAHRKRILDKASDKIRLVSCRANSQ